MSNTMTDGQSEAEVALDIKSDEDRYKAIRHVIPAAGIGHFVEWFDFALYGTLATTIGINFFRQGDAQAAMLSTFAVFAAGFVARPLGGIFWGSLGDRLGRQKILSAVVLMTSAATFLMGVIPTYDQLGVWASALLVFLRLLQGFAAGGETSGSSALLTEFAPSNRRGFVSSFLEVFGFASYLSGAGVVLLLTAIVGDDTITAWAWRLPFMLALPLGLVGLYMRLKLEETPEFKASKKLGKVKKAPLRFALKTQWKALLYCCAFTTIKASGYWMLETFMPSYMQTDLGYGKMTSYGATFLGFILGIILVAPMGLLSDKVGRRPVLIGGCLGFIVLTYPCLMLMNVGSFWAATGAMTVLCICLSSIGGTIAAAVSELFPTDVRYGSLSLSYNIAVCIIGGLTPFIATWLVGVTGNKLAPAFWLMATAIISLVAFVMSQETANKPLAG